MIPTRSIVTISGLLFVAISLNGCFQTVARIHVDEAGQVVVERLAAADEQDELPLVSTRGDGQALRVEDNYRLRLVVEAVRNEGQSSPYDLTATSGQELYWLRGGADLVVDEEGSVEIIGQRRRYRFSLDRFDRGEVLRPRPAGTVLAGIGTVVLFGGLIAGIAVAAAASAVSNLF